jgi:hypothetical protein
MTSIRSAIENALNEVIAFQEAFKFQSIAISIAKRRWPELVASEWQYDLGRDAYVSASTSPDGRGKALASSLTATLAKVRHDAAENAKHSADISILIFVTPHRLTNHATRMWAEEIRRDYGYELIVVSREDLLNELAHPANSWICRELLGVPVGLLPSVSELLAHARTASAAELSAWESHPGLAGRPRIALDAVRLTTDGLETGELLDLSGLRALLDQSRRAILEGPAGAGKTTTLISLAADYATTTGGSVAFLVDFPAWVRSHRPILDFIASTPTYLAQGLTSADLARLTQSVHSVFLLNGWNEVPDSYSVDSVQSLRELERNFRVAGIMIATRVHYLTPPLPGAGRFSLRRLTSQQRARYLETSLGARADECERQLRDDEALDQLTRTPFILAEIAELFRAGQAIPRTTLGVLNAVIRLFEESDEHRAALDSSPLAGAARAYLSALALAMTKGGGTTILETEARACVGQVSEDHRRSGQLSVVPDPLPVLNALTAHHVLERVVWPESAFRFQHQQFQELFAASALTNALSDDDAIRLTRDYLNWPAWDAAAYLVAEELGSSVDARDAASVGRLVIAALSIDPIFAARLMAHSGAKTWQNVRDSMSHLLRRWHATNDEHHSLLAVAAMLETGASDFQDIILPLVTHPDHERRAQIYSLVEEFKPTSLGLDWRFIVAEWDEPLRADLARHLPAELALDFALHDASLNIRVAATLQLRWQGAEALLVHALERSDDQLFSAILRQSIPGRLPYGVRERARAIYRTWTANSTDAVQRLRLLRSAEMLIGDHDVAALKAALEQVAAGRLSDGDRVIVAHAAADVAKTDPDWIAGWTVARIVDGTLWGGEWAPLVRVLTPEGVETLLSMIESEDLADVNRALPILARLADVDIAGKAFRRWCVIRRQPISGVNANRHAPWNLLRLLQEMPTGIAAEGIRATVAIPPEETEYRLVTELLMGASPAAATIYEELAPAVRNELREYLKSGVPFALEHDDPSGALKRQVSAAFARIGEPADMPVIERIIQADLAREREAREAWLRGDREGIGAGATMRCSNWHTAAVEKLDPDRASDVLIALLSEPTYEDDAMAALVRLARVAPEPSALGRRRINYDAIWAARSGAPTPEFDDARRHRHAAALRQHVERIVAERDRSAEPASFTRRLKRFANGLAILDGRRSASLILDILAVQADFDEWDSVGGLEALLHSGATLPFDALNRILEPVIERIRSKVLYDQQAQWLLMRAVCLFPYSDPPAAGVNRLAGILFSLPLPGHELGNICLALGASRCPEALTVLRQIAAAAPPGFSESSYGWTDWISAVHSLGTSDAQHELLSFIDPTIGTSALPGQAGAHAWAALMSHLAVLARTSSDVRDRLLALCFSSLDRLHRGRLAHLIVQWGDREAVLHGLELIRDDVPTGIAEAVRIAVLERRPVGATLTLSCPPLRSIFAGDSTKWQSMTKLVAAQRSHCSA